MDSRSGGGIGSIRQHGIEAIGRYSTINKRLQWESWVRSWKKPVPQGSLPPIISQGVVCLSVGGADITDVGVTTTGRVSCVGVDKGLGGRPHVRVGPHLGDVGSAKTCTPLSISKSWVRP